MVHTLINVNQIQSIVIGEIQNTIKITLLNGTRYFEEYTNSDEAITRFYELEKTTKQFILTDGKIK